MEFYEILRNLRKEKGVELKDVANDLSIPYNNIARYERGACEPSIKTLILLAKYYKVSVDYLIGNNDKGVYISEQEYKDIETNTKSLDIMYKTLKKIEKRKTNSK